MNLGDCSEKTCLCYLFLIVFIHVIIIIIYLHETYKLSISHSVHIDLHTVTLLAPWLGLRPPSAALLDYLRKMSSQ